MYFVQPRVCHRVWDMSIEIWHSNSPFLMSTWCKAKQIHFFVTIPFMMLTSWQMQERINKISASLLEARKEVVVYWNQWQLQWLQWDQILLGNFCHLHSYWQSISWCSSFKQFSTNRAVQKKKKKSRYVSY